MPRSPIEIALRDAVRIAANLHDVNLLDYTAIPAQGMFEPAKGFLMLSFRDPDPRGKVEEYGIEDGDHWTLWADVTIDSYRIDFMLDAGYGELAIECDGHDFHDRTKQQAAYDRSRDRWLLARGLSTARFTGSEIVHSPERCAQEIYEISKVMNRRGYALSRVGCSNVGIPYV
jgi:very-short-patch-repair endonuclease